MLLQTGCRPEAPQQPAISPPGGITCIMLPCSAEVKELKMTPTSLEVPTSLVRTCHNNHLTHHCLLHPRSGTIHNSQIYVHSCNSKCFSPCKLLPYYISLFYKNLLERYQQVLSRKLRPIKKSRQTTVPLSKGFFSSAKCKSEFKSS